MITKGPIRPDEGKTTCLGALKTTKPTVPFKSETSQYDEETCPRPRRARALYETREIRLRPQRRAVDLGEPSAVDLGEATLTRFPPRPHQASSVVSFLSLHSCAELE